MIYIYIYLAISNWTSLAPSLLSQENTETDSPVDLNIWFKLRNFKLTLYVKMATPDLQRYPWNLDLIKNVGDNVVLLNWTFLWPFSIILIRKKYASHFGRETTIVIKQFKETKILLCNSYLIRKIFQWYKCESGIAIFEQRGT